MKDPISGRKSWVVETPVRSLAFNRGGQDWSVIVSWPLAERLSPLTALGKRVLFLYLFLGGASLLFLNHSFDEIISRPVRRLAEQARRYMDGDYGQRTSGSEDAMELRELSRALNALGKKLGEAANPGQDREGGHS